MPDSRGPLHLREQLDQTRSLAETGRYEQALNLIRTVKANHARNVYILAFERQLEQLNELSQQRILTEEQKQDILESFPGISERALEGGSIDTFQPAPRAQDREEKAAALEWLKSQYFQHAHDYVRKGEYQNALAEIRRVYVIEPENRIAPEFEQQIIELSRLRAQERAKAASPLLGSPASAASPPMIQESAYQHARMPVASPEPPRDAMRESPPPFPARAKPFPASTPAETQARPRHLLWVLIVIVLIAAAILFYWRWSSRGGGTSDPGSKTPISSEELQGKGDKNAWLAREQTFSISPTDRESGKDSPLVVHAGGGTELEASPGAERFASPSPWRIARLSVPKFSPGDIPSNLHGRVVVRVQVDSLGNAVQVDVISSTNSVLDNPVIEAALNSRFSAVSQSTVSAVSWITIPFRFVVK